MVSVSTRMLWRELGRERGPSPLAAGYRQWEAEVAGAEKAHAMHCAEMSRLNGLRSHGWYETEFYPRNSRFITYDADDLPWLKYIGRVSRLVVPRKLWDVRQEATLELIGYTSADPVLAIRSVDLAYREPCPPCRVPPNAPIEPVPAKLFRVRSIPMFLMGVHFVVWSVAAEDAKFVESSDFLWRPDCKLTDRISVFAANLRAAQREINLRRRGELR